MENLVPEIIKTPSLRGDYPPMCIHQSPVDDFQYKFRGYFSLYTLAMYYIILYVIIDMNRFKILLYFHQLLDY
jgi:hypothetical protein